MFYTQKFFIGRVRTRFSEPYRVEKTILVDGNSDS